MRSFDVVVRILRVEEVNTYQHVSLLVITRCWRNCISSLSSAVGIGTPCQTVSASRHGPLQVSLSTKRGVHVELLSRFAMATCVTQIRGTRPHGSHNALSASRSGHSSHRTKSCVNVSTRRRQADRGCLGLKANLRKFCLHKCSQRWRVSASIVRQFCAGPCTRVSFESSVW